MSSGLGQGYHVRGMAKPRVFVSSTFYDLRQVRSELDHFIREMGYEPVLNEMGDIAYDHRRPLEESCFEEITKVDILVSIVGGRFGTQSGRDTQSISQHEVQTAIQQRKPVALFVDRNVHAEYRTYRQNMGLPEDVLVKFKWHHVDDVRVFAFLDKMNALPLNNATFDFSLASDITRTLKAQWAGLFQASLQRDREDRHRDVLVGLEASLRTAQDLAKLLGERADTIASAGTVERVLLSNHPAFQVLRRLMKVDYPTPFYSRDELVARMRGWGFDVDGTDEQCVRFMRRKSKQKGDFDMVTVSQHIFDRAGKLAIGPADFRDDMIEYDDIPF